LSENVYAVDYFGLGKTATLSENRPVDGVKVSLFAEMMEKGNVLQSGCGRWCPTLAIPS